MYNILGDLTMYDIEDRGAYTCEMKTVDKSYSSLIKQAISVKVLGESSDKSDQSDDVLMVKLMFAPSKSFR